MALSCDCGWDDYDYDYYYEVEDIERIACAGRRCYGCCKPIHIGDEVRKVDQYKYDEDGNENYTQVLGSLCPVCSGLYDSLIELGFCISADWGFITEAMDDYRELYHGRTFNKR